MSTDKQTKAVALVNPNKDAALVSHMDEIKEIIAQNHSEYNVDRVNKELQYMYSHDMLDYLLKAYKKNRNNGIIGQKNRFNLLVAFLLGITTKFDPTQSFCPEERRTYARDGFPDIDMDFDHERRHEIVEYLVEKYGRECVANIGAVQKLKIKAALRRVIKVLDPSHAIRFVKENNKWVKKETEGENFRFQNEILRSLPDEPMKKADGSIIDTLQKAYDEYPDFRRHMDTYPEIFRLAQKFEGNISAFSIHAAGIILSPIPLKQIAPLHVTREYSQDKKEESEHKNTIATQYSMKDVESLGLIKFDILAISTKTAMKMAVDLIQKNHNKFIDLRSLPLDDKKTLDLITTGRTNAVFQLEEYGMQKTVQQIRMDSFGDLAAAVALYRPGPKDFIPDYARRKRNPESVTYLHPTIKQNTQDTYGIIVYQEQAMRIFVDLAGLTESEGYTFIKGAAKKNPTLFMSMKDRFILGASKKAGADIAARIWDQLQPFQGYAFNKAHAYAYAYESYKCAYLKAHYPLEFMAARMSVEAKRRKFEDVQKYEEDCQYLGITIEPPDLNKSKLAYTISGDKTLRAPLFLKGIGDKAAEDIVANQPYKGPDILYSFAIQVGKSINIKAVEALCDAGLFKETKKKKSVILRDFEQIKSDKKALSGRQTKKMFS